MKITCFYHTSSSTTSFRWSTDCAGPVPVLTAEDSFGPLLRAVFVNYFVNSGVSGHMTNMDSILLQQLQRPNPSLTYPALEGLISHHLSWASPPQPTPLAAAVISSLLWHPINTPRLAHLTASIRRATQQRAKIVEDESSILSPNKRLRFDAWVTAVLRGFRGGDALLRLAACGGLLQGLEDLKGTISSEISTKSTVENEIALSLAEIMETAQLTGRWDAEFTSQTPAGTGLVALKSFVLPIADKVFQSVFT